MSNLKVTKRNGNLEDYNESKIDDVLKWAVISCSEKKDNQNYIQLEVPDIISEIKANAHIQLYNGISTDDIHLLLIKSAADLISEKQPEMQYIAARLALFRIRKLAFGDFFPPELYTHITNLTELGLYDSQILKDYSREEIENLDDLIDHGRDISSHWWPK